DLVVVFEELAGLVDLRLHVMLAGLGSDADLLELLLPGLAALLRRLEAHLAVVEDLAHRRALVGGPLHHGQAGLPGSLQRLRGGHQAQLLAARADQADGADADLLVHPGAALLRRCSVEMSDVVSPQRQGEIPGAVWVLVTSRPGHGPLYHRRS